MYLKEIKAYGFKSFADKINIELGANLNGIVGPNGSGKSNIVDAVRWVLGEQSIKSLRGDNATDIIFSGSKSRKALNSASVTLVFDNTDKSLALDFNEVSIKRILYRTGENEYFINNERVRLKDITELLMDTGGSKESFNIISQGKIDEIVLAKPLDRRVIIEEAAGVLKYKKRKEEALRKLDRTNLNLNRVNDVICELEVNLNPLKEQAQTATTYLKLKEDLKNVEVALITKDIDNLNFEYSTVKENIASLTDEILKNSNSASSYDVDILKEKNKIKDLDININIKQKELIELTKKLEQKDADYRLLKERRKYAENDNTTSLKIMDLKESILNQKNIIESDNIDLNNLNNKILSLKDSIKKQEENYSSLKEKREKSKNILAKNQRDLVDLKYKIDYLENSINNSNTLPTSVKTILNNKKIDGVHNILGKLIEFDNIYSLAINTALMNSVNNLIVDNTNIAKTLIKYLKENNLGRTTFYPIDVIKPRNIPSNIIDDISNIDGYIDVAANLITCNKIYQDIIKNLLGNVIIAKDIDSANKIAKIINNSFKVVTIDGQVINVGGSLTGGSAIKVSNVIKEKYDLENNNKLYNKIISDNETLEYQLRLLDNEISTEESNIYDIRVNINNLNSEYSIKLDSINGKKKVLEQNIQELKDLEDISSSNTTFAEQNLMSEYYEIKSSVTILEKEIESLITNKGSLDEELRQLEELSRNSNMYLSKKEKELSNLEIKANRIDVRLDNLLLNLTEDYNLTFDAAKASYILDIDEEDARVKVSSLKQKLKDIGIVNVGAIEEYERVNTRYLFLDRQRSDLENAKDTLFEIIKEMDTVMIDKFKTTFDAIKLEFRKVFRELFKGGDAEIILTDPSNLLETGVDIKAEPPGKHLQNISLLSGGEKTFTAISLLFAILNVRPVPFCLLDEVEAALDDANVDAFCKYLDKYRNQTQFILITHKKKTMEYIDLLYGITMQESGVSKLVSVKLEDVRK